MRRIGLVSVARSDYGAYLPILRSIQGDVGLQLQLIVAGAHLMPEFGSTVDAITADGFEIAERVDMLSASDTPEAIAEAMGRGTAGFARAYARLRPDLLVVLGDRFEMHAAALAALPMKIPVAHIHGGELTQGAIDDALRHSMTKLSHLHFVATEAYARRVLQMGEEPWRVTICGAPSLDRLRTMSLWDRAELARRFSLRLDGDVRLVTFHPVTLEYEQTRWQVEELLAALEDVEGSSIFTAPNADTNGRLIRSMLRAFVDRHPQAQLIENFGTQGYFSLMAIATAMVGNSSSGIIEAPSFHLPVVNIGTRQDGRLRAENVIDVGYGRDDIRRGLAMACSPAFRRTLIGRPNPYGDGRAADIIVTRLREVTLDDRLIRKRFVDLPVTPARAARAEAVHAS